MTSAREDLHGFAVHDKEHSPDHSVRAGRRIDAYGIELLSSVAGMVLEVVDAADDRGSEGERSVAEHILNRVLLRVDEIKRGEDSA